MALIRRNPYMSEKANLIHHLNSVFYGPAWHGDALFPTLKNLPFPKISLHNSEGYSAWGILLHCAYWKHQVLLKLDPDCGSFDRHPEDFPKIPLERSFESWLADLDFLEENHRLLVDAVQEMAEDRFPFTPSGGSFNLVGYILGAGAHDVYHTAHLRNLFP